MNVSVQIERRTVVMSGFMILRLGRKGYEEDEESRGNANKYLQEGEDEGEWKQEVHEFLIEVSNLTCIILYLSLLSFI